MSYRAAAGVQQYWAEQLDLLRRLPAAVRAQEPESIHDLRAAGRRTKSTVRTFRPLLRRPLATTLLAELDWYNAMLGHARDAEVVRAGAAESLAGGRTSRAIEAALAAEQHRTLQLAENMLAGQRAEALLDHVQELVEAPWRGDRVDAPPRGSDLLKRVAWAERRVAKAWGKGPLPNEQPTQWQHRVRRRAKSARYTYEALAVESPELAESAQRYAEVASLLGIIQDSVVINRALAQWPTEVVGKAIAERDRLASEALAEVPAALDAALTAH